MNHHNSFVFHDASGRRWSRFKSLIFFFSIIISLLTVIFIKSLFVKPVFNIPQNVYEIKTILKKMDTNIANNNISEKDWLAFTKKNENKNIEYHSYSGSDPVRLGFYINWDRRSWKSLLDNGKFLTHIASDWFTVSLNNKRLKINTDDELLNFLKKKNINFIPVLKNLDIDKWMPEAVEDIVKCNSDEQLIFINQITDEINRINASGLIVDFGLIDPSYKDNYTGFFRLLSNQLKENKKQLWLSMPMGKELASYDIEELSLFIDKFIATLHDENSEVDSPGSISSLDWVKGWSETVSSYGSPEQWIIGLGNYGYDWQEGSNMAELISFADSMTRAKKSGITSLEMSEEDFEPNFTYELNGKIHNVWFLDAVTFLNSYHAAATKMKGGVSINPLGFEDPSLWEIFSDFTAEEPSASDELISKIEKIRTDDIIANIGNGEMLVFDNTASDGKREIRRNNDGFFIETYKAVPSYYNVSRQRSGSSKVAITFDDGPDPKYTPKLLDILKQNNVSATFFILGIKAEKYPEIVKRIVDEGHLIGIHSYTHPDIYQASSERITLELNASERLIQDITGKSTLLFRAPYSDNKPISYGEFNPFVQIQDMGYFTVSYTIDSKDWEKPGVNNILENIKNERREGNVILLHDAGGDRSQTIEALPLIIKFISDRGDKIVSLEELLGIDRNALMPAVDSNQQNLTSMVTGTGFHVIRLLKEFFWAFMIIATILVVMRAIAVLFFALKYKSDYPKNSDEFSPPVSILISAYNEEKVIEKTLLSLINSDYNGDKEIIVVDDGSGDETTRVVANLAKKYPEIILVTQENTGKAIALRRGVSISKNEIIIMLDADTQFQKNTVKNLVLPFMDLKTGAVSGHARVGNTKNFITHCQDIEYISAFNLDRRAFHQLNCITVVPGAVCAVRKTALLEAGGITNDTLAEDTDFTLNLYRTDYRVVYAKDAVAWTEAPESVNALIKQRFRWGFGTLQCLWKHRDMAFSKNYGVLGLFAMPAMWFFNIFLLALGPVIDIFFLISLINHFNPILYAFFTVFFLIDIILAVLSCNMEHENIKKSFFVIPMRFFYKAILGYVMWKVLLKAIQGIWVGWGKLDRSASVSVNLDNILVKS